MKWSAELRMSDNELWNVWYLFRSSFFATFLCLVADNGISDGLIGKTAQESIKETQLFSFCNAISMERFGSNLKRYSRRWAIVSFSAKKMIPENGLW